MLGASDVGKPAPPNVAGGFGGFGGDFGFVQTPAATHGGGFANFSVASAPSSANCGGSNGLLDGFSGLVIGGNAGAPVTERHDSLFPVSFNSGSDWLGDVGSSSAAQVEQAPCCVV